MPAEITEVFKQLEQMEICMKRSCNRERLRLKKLQKASQLARATLFDQYKAKRIDHTTWMSKLDQLGKDLRQSKEFIALQECRFTNCCSEVIDMCQDYVKGLQKDCNAGDVAIPADRPNREMMETYNRQQREMACEKLSKAQELLKQSPIPYRQIFALMSDLS